MLNLINILTLSTALTLQPTAANLQIIVNEEINNIISNSTIRKEESKDKAFIIYGLTEDKKIYNSLPFTNYQGATQGSLTNSKYICIGYKINTYDIERFKNFNTIKQKEEYYLFTNTITPYKGSNTYSIDFNIRRKTFMEELLTALTTAVQSAVTIFVEGFGGLTQIFYNGTEITFIGGILIVGLAVMFLMMFLRWIVSFVKGI